MKYNQEKDSNNDLKTNIDFARNVFINVQELIRFMDQKSSLTLVIIGLLSTAAFAVLGIYLGDSNLPGMEKYLIFILALWYLFHISQVIWNAFQTLIARPHMLGNTCDAPEMLFPLMLLERYKKSDSKYLEKLINLSDTEILADYSQQILEVSNIYMIKQRHVNRSFKYLRWSTLPWFIFIVVILIKSFLF